MKKGQLLCMSSVMVLALCLCGVTAWGQKSTLVKIPFNFTIGANDFTAGQYSIRPNENMNALTVHNLDKNETVNVPILTRLSSRGEKNVQLVFDKTEDKNFLTEIYFPGTDGFHMQGAPGKHTHTKLEVK